MGSTNKLPFFIALSIFCWSRKQICELSLHDHWKHNSHLMRTYFHTIFWLIYRQIIIYLAIIPAVFIAMERNPGSNQTPVLPRLTMCVQLLGKPSKMLEHNITVVVPVILLQLKHPDSQSLHYRICVWWDFNLATTFQVHAASATKCLSFNNLQGCCSWSHHLSTRLIFCQC